MTPRARRSFTEEFKREAVRLKQTIGRTISQVAEGIGIGLSTLTRWKRKIKSAIVQKSHWEHRGDFRRNATTRPTLSNFLDKI